MVLPYLASILACQTDIEDQTSFVEFVNVSDGINLRSVPIDDGFGFEVVDDSQFAIRAENVSVGLSELNSDAFGLVQMDSTETQITATWNDQSIVGYKTTSETIPAIIGYDTQLIPSTKNSSSSVLTQDGTLYAFDEELWWISDQPGSLAQLVGVLSEPILGLNSGHIDGDGVLDAVVFSSGEAVLLRGRPYGGFFRQQIVRPIQDDHFFFDARINKLNEDQHGDVALATSSESQTTVTVLDGDGAWDFERREPLIQPFASISMVASDEDDDGVADITLIDDLDGAVRRYTYSIEGWIGGFPSIIDPASFVALSGAQLGPSRDINGDDINDILIFDGEGSTNQDLVFFTFGESITKYSQTYLPYYSAVVDVDKNGTFDIFSLSEEYLHLTYFDDESEAFSVRNLNTISTQGPLTARDLDEDGLVDIRVLSTQPIQVNGSLGESEKWTPKNVLWREDSSINILDGMFTVGEINEETVVGAIIDINGDTRLKVWRFGEDFTSLTPISDLSFGNSTVSDLKICDGYFYLINNNGTSQRFRKIELSNNTLSLKNRTDVEQDYFECAIINNEVNYLLWGGVETYIILQEDLVNIDAGDAEGWNDADIGIPADGATQLKKGCSGTNCQVEYADLNGDGDEELILGNANGITISGLTDGDITLSVNGVLSTSDLNNNGTEELIVQTDSWFWIFHYKDQSVGNIQGTWIDGTTQGRTYFADVNGDGLLETIRESSTQTLLTSAFPEVQ